MRQVFNALNGEAPAGSDSSLSTHPAFAYCLRGRVSFHLSFLWLGNFVSRDDTGAAAFVNPKLHRVSASVSAILLSFEKLEVRLLISLFIQKEGIKCLHK